jgi:hypothetical protein
MACLKHLVQRSFDRRLRVALSQFLGDISGFYFSFNDDVSGWHYTEIIGELWIGWDLEGDDCSLMEILTRQLFYEGLRKITINFSDDNRESAQIRAAHLSEGDGLAQSVKRLKTGWTDRGSNPGGGERVSLLLTFHISDFHPEFCYMGTVSPSRV